MHYKTRNTPGEPESFSKNKQRVMLSKNVADIKKEHGLEPSVGSVLGALMWIAFRTRPDISGAVTRVSQAA
eukprot:7114127-Prorocentrum_lima.AAC.1